MPEGFRAKQIKEELVLASPDGPPMPLRMTSDGPRCMVAMVLDILRGLEDCHGALQIEDQQVLNPGVVLIDEPDNHLHIHWQLGLGSWMKGHFPRIQFIVATHSPFLCAAANRIWRLDDEEGRIEPRALSNNEMREIRAGSVTTVLESDAFRIFNTLPVEARERHTEFLRLRRLELQGKRLSKADRTLLSELKQEFFGPEIPRDPEFDALVSLTSPLGTLGVKKIDRSRNAFLRSSGTRSAEAQHTLTPTLYQRGRHSPPSPRPGEGAPSLPKKRTLRTAGRRRRAEIPTPRPPPPAR